MSQMQTKRISERGAHTIATPQSTPLAYLSLDLMNLDAGDTQEWNTGERESALVLLSGEVEMEGGGLSLSASRKGVFEEAATTLYLPPETQGTVRAVSAAQVAVCSSKATGAKAAFIVKPEEVKTVLRGEGNFSRKVCDIIDGERDVNCLVLGETFNGPGNWSSYPPHRHDEERLPEEVDLEEIYFFKLDPEQGFGMMRVYTGDGRVDEPMVIEQDDTVIIHEGYHPVVAAGGYQLYYLWFLAGPGRALVPFDDPAHKWVKDL